MKLSGSNKPEYQPHPEFDGQAICVDVTPPRRTKSEFGDRETFRIVFETTELREDGRPFLLHSRNFTPSLHEKSAFRAFLKQWFGRDLTAQEHTEFDTESLVGRPARVSVVHNEWDGKVFANIGLIRPDRSKDPLKPSGKYIRVQDRESKDGQFRAASGGDGDGSDWRRAKVHVGKHAGLDLGDLDQGAVEALINRWLPDAMANPKPLKADRDLIAALRGAAEVLGIGLEEDDNIPF
ncbi:MAG: hypothetical protein J0M04_05975 [Verrucomicrobia bacterium]|nr:hypothetical protein [Verrucomicrobiota bacterium]